jgi:hypothetical protein
MLMLTQFIQNFRRYFQCALNLHAYEPLQYDLKLLHTKPHFSIMKSYDKYRISL